MVQIFFPYGKRDFQVGIVNVRFCDYNEGVKISYANSRIRKLCTDAKEARKKYGKDGADVLEERLKQMRNAQCLEDLRLLPGGWHELTQNRKGQLACSLLGMNRLVFQPNNNPRPTKPDGGLDWTQVTAIMNLEIVDYH